MSVVRSRSILQSLQRSFDLLVCDPAPLAVDCRGLPGLPQQAVPLDELRALLIADGTALPVRDAVWRLLVQRARCDGPSWVVGAVGMALPGLMMQATRLHRAGVVAGVDVEADLVEGFYLRLATVDVQRPRVCGRLLDAAARAVRTATAAAEEALPVAAATARSAGVRSGWFGSVPPPQPWGHPDWLLTRAVAAAVIDVDEHVLVGRTYLEGVPLTVVARQLGISAGLAGRWRRNAVGRLVSALQAGELDAQHPSVLAA